MSVSWGPVGGSGGGGGQEEEEEEEEEEEMETLDVHLPGRDERKNEHLQHPHQQLSRKREVDLGLW